MLQIWYKHVLACATRPVELLDDGFPLVAVVVVFPCEGIQLGVAEEKHEHDRYKH